MRFGEDDQNYFFVIDQNGMFWVNPAEPESVGKIYKNLTDADGQRYIKTIINNANSGERAFVQYQAFKSGSTAPSTKLVHFKKFEKWNWIVCAGIFVDDIDVILESKEQQIENALINQIKLFSLGELLALLISISISQRFFKIKLVKPIEELTIVAQEMVDGNFKSKINIDSSYEINKLVNAIQRMQDSFTIVYERLRVRTIQANNLKLVKERRKNNGISNIQLEKSI
jgi:methyl-accepting chemotaxis protein